MRAGDGVARSIAEAAAHVERAEAALGRLPTTPAADALAAAARHLLVGLER